MGCDIHMYSEIKLHDYSDKERVNGAWISADKWRQGLAKDYKTGKLTPYMYLSYEDYIYDGRNYYLFTVLANVRRKPEVKPISSPRGLPDDVSSLVKSQSVDAGDGVHSHSYVTLRELLEYDWNQPIESAESYDSEYEAIQAHGSNILSIVEYDGRYRVNYQMPLLEIMNDFMESIEELKKLMNTSSNPAQVVTEDDIRIVFWFDN